MDCELSELDGLEVYTDQGILLGSVEDSIVNFDTGRVVSLFIPSTNPTLIEYSKAVAVPYRWIESIGDIILLKHFPGFVSSDAPPDRHPKLHAMRDRIVSAEHHLVEEVQALEHKLEERIHPPHGEPEEDHED